MKETLDQLKQEGLTPGQLQLVQQVIESILAEPLPEVFSWEMRACQWAKMFELVDRMKARTMNITQLIEIFRQEPLLTENELAMIEDQLSVEPTNLIEWEAYADRWDRVVHRVECAIEQRRERNEQQSK